MDMSMGIWIWGILTFSIGYGDGYEDVYICPIPIPVIIFVPAIFPPLFKLLKYSWLM